MTFSERDVHKVIAELTAARWRVREIVRVREVASLHRLEQVRRLRMLTEQEVWKREGGFDRIEILAKMYEQTLRRLHAAFDLEPLYTGL